MTSDTDRQQLGYQAWINARRLEVWRHRYQRHQRDRQPQKEKYHGHEGNS